MSISFDVFSDGGTATATSLSWSHTVTGSNPILFVGVAGSTGADVITGVTYNTVPLTKINTRQDTRVISLWYLIGPATGSSHSILISASGSDFIAGSAVSYAGSSQTGQPDNKNTNGNAAVTSLTTSLTTVADNCWTVLYGVSDSGGANLSAGASTTIRGKGLGTQGGFFDSNAAITPAGSTSLIFNSNTSASKLSACMASLSPFVASSAKAGFLFNIL